MKIEAVGKPPGCKLLRISAELSEPPGDDSIVKSISIRGDFFAIPEDEFETVEKRLAGTPVAELAHVFDALTAEMRIRAIGISGSGILATLRGAIDEISVQDTANRL
ncbi:MAG: hypothetical protein WBH97_03455 [Rectinemataceae bacterium]